MSVWNIRVIFEPDVSLHFFYQANIDKDDDDDYDDDEENENNSKLVTTTSQYTFMRVKWGRSNYRITDISLESEASCELVLRFVILVFVWDAF